LHCCPRCFAEGGAVHLLVPDGWLWPKAALAALHLYGVIMLLSWAVGERTHPHRLRGGELELRGGQLYRARVETANVAAVELVPRRDGQRSCLVLGDGPARLAVRGRTDVLLRFGVPVRVERPLGGPIPGQSSRSPSMTPHVSSPQSRRRAPSRPAATDNRAALLGWFAPVRVSRRRPHPGEGPDAFSGVTKCVGSFSRAAVTTPWRGWKTAPSRVVRSQAG